MRAALAVTVVLLVGGFSGCTCSNEWGGSCETRADCPPGGLCLDGECVPGASDGDADVDVDGTVPTCHDEDGDGYGIGEGCRGPDCNDSDPRQTGVEVCDGYDNDCDGEVDEGVLSSCGTCDHDCVATGSGVGTDDPFDLEEHENEGVALDSEGAIVLDSRVVDTGFIWIANTVAGQVVKVDTDTFLEVGRYATDSDPSRTSVNSAGDVYVGNRAGQSVTKISVLGEGCPDTNGDGVVTTSAGGGDVLPFGQDDCMLWHTELPDGGIIRAVAAQDELGPDGELFPYVWVGGWSGVIWKLDGNTGEVLLRTTSPVLPYGFALDGRGNLWIGNTGSVLGRIDTRRCRDDASCEVEVCVGEGAECDGAVKQRITMPTSGYGITVDFMQRVWVGGATIKRYDFSAPVGERWAQVAPGFGCHGIGADGLGFVYAACEGNRSIVRVDADDPTSWLVISTQNNRGIGIDADGKIWGINRSSSIGTANVLTPGPTIGENELVVGVGPVLSSPYTYSDMTGMQLRLATNPRGYYRYVVEGCPAPTETVWGELDWEAEVPAGTRVIVRARTAESRTALESAPWLVVANMPPDEPPVDMAAALDEAGVLPGRFLMIELILEAERTSVTEVITPRILSIEQQFHCPSHVG